MNNNDLENSAIKTLAYFDQFKFPLTKEELFRFLWQPPTGIKYQDFCGQLASFTSVSSKFGYYFLPGRETIVEDRRRAIVPTELKLEKARRAVKFIRHIPFLRAVFVCSSVAVETAKPESDIDFFIVAQAGHIWIVRFFCNLILRLLGLRVYGDKIKDRICLSFFADTDHLDLYPYRVAVDDVHWAFFYPFLLPIYDPDNLLAVGIQANSWLVNFLPNALGINIATINVKNTKLGLAWKNLWEKMWGGAYGSLIEKLAKDWQIGKMKISIKEKSQLNDFGVIVSDGILKFHENDSRRSIREKWLNTLQEYGL